MGFRIGDGVQWTSQANGSTRTKQGVVAEVVPAAHKPDRVRFSRLYKHSGCGCARDHESYVVMVGNKPYWPRANVLRPAAGACPYCGHQIQ